jgi:hypothetical protein
MVKVIQTDPPVEKEVLADAIVRVSEGVAALNKSGLNQRAVVVLLHDYTGLPMTAIRRVLNALPELKGMYCK